MPQAQLIYPSPNLAVKKAFFFLLWKEVSYSDRKELVDGILSATYKTLHENGDSVVTSLSVVKKAV